MIELSVASIHKEGFSISLGDKERDGAIRLKFSGNGDMEATPVLGTYLKQLHADACRIGIQEVVFDFSDLYFMNSSCFKCFVSWISSVTKLEKTQRYAVRFVSNPQLHWQRRSLEALRCFAPETVAVETATG